MSPSVSLCKCVPTVSPPQVSDTCHVLLEAADEGVQSLGLDQLADKLRSMQAVADDTGKGFILGNIFCSCLLRPGPEEFVSFLIELN